MPMLTSPSTATANAATDSAIVSTLHAGTVLGASMPHGSHTRGDSTTAVAPRSHGHAWRGSAWRWKVLGVFRDTYSVLDAHTEPTRLEKQVQTSETPFGASLQYTPIGLLALFRARARAHTHDSSLQNFVNMLVVRRT